jgi:hypothetical protein
MALPCSFNRSAFSFLLISLSSGVNRFTPAIFLRFKGAI